MKFYHKDTEEDYLLHKDLLGDEWIYYNYDIEYNINSHNLRCKELEDINFNNYIIVVGNAHTFGRGLNHKDMWSNILADKLKVDVVNLSQEGFSSEESLIALQDFLKVYPEPKHIFFQWSAPNQTNDVCYIKSQLYKISNVVQFTTNYGHIDIPYTSDPNRDVKLRNTYETLLLDIDTINESYSRDLLGHGIKRQKMIVDFLLSKNRL